MAYQDIPEGTIADGPNGAIILRGGQWVPYREPARQSIPSVQVRGPDPTKALQTQKLQAELDPTLIQAQRDAAVANAQKAQAEASKAATDAAQGKGDSSGSATVRKDAINAFNATVQLDELISGLEARFKEGPGATKGVFGLQDYLPTVSNQRFDEAGNAVRGPAITALGFTASQSNTPAEVAQNIGPYIPKAGDYDQVILDKIARLKKLRDRARTQAISTLGGVPDQNGQITPVNKLPDDQKRALGFLPPQTGGPSQGFGGSSPNGPTGPRGEPLLKADEQVAFTGDQRPPTAPRLSPAQAAEINRATLAGNFDEARRLSVQYMGAALDRGAQQKIFDYGKTHPGWTPAIDYSVVDQSAQSAADRARYGDYLPGAIEDRKGAALGSAGRGALTSLTLGAAPYVAAGLQSGVGLWGNFEDRLQHARALEEADYRVNPGARLTGDIVGGAASAGGLEYGLARTAGRLPGVLGAIGRSPLTADAVYGTTRAGFDSGFDPTQTGLGGLAGVGGGVAGRAGTRAIGSAISGVTRPTVQALRESGIPLTVGQTLGGVAKGIEDRLAGLPIVGDMVNARRLEGIQGFNRAAFDQGVAPINANTVGAIGEPGIDAMRAARNQAYSNALDPVSLQVDPQFGADITNAALRGADLPPSMADNVAATLRLRVDDNIDGAGNMAGRDFQQSIRGLRRDAKAQESQPYGYDFGDVTRAAEAGLEGMLERQAPGALGGYRSANALNRNYEVLREAVNSARNSGSRLEQSGVFMPSQLAGAAASNAKRFGGTHGTTNQPFFDLTRAGQEVLPSAVPDSGTAGRLAALALPGALGGAGAGLGYAGGDTSSGAGYGLGLGALLSAGGSRAAQRLLTTALLDRPDALRTLGTQIYNRPRAVGAIGTALGAGYLPPLLAGN